VDHPRHGALTSHTPDGPRGFGLTPEENQPPRSWRWWAAGAAVLAVLAAAAVTFVLIGHGGTSTPAAGPEPTAAAPQVGCDTDKGRTLTKLGATPLDWAAGHVLTYGPELGPRTRWDPRADLPRFSGHVGAVYNDTRFYDNCLVGAYYVQLARPVAESVALSRGLRELPSDAHVVSRRLRPRCTQYAVSSDELVAALKARDNYPDSTRVLIQLPHRRGTRVAGRIQLGIVQLAEIATTACPP
jgi:hypothetical protein